MRYVFGLFFVAVVLVGCGGGEEDAGASKTEAIATGTPAGCFLDWPKATIIDYLAERGITPTAMSVKYPDPQSDQFDAPGVDFCDITWQQVNGQWAVESVCIGSPSVPHEPGGYEPVLAVWERIDPRMAAAFRQLIGDYPELIGFGKCPYRLYNDTPFGYSIAPNNKYFVQFMTKDDVHHLEEVRFPNRDRRKK